MERTLPCLLITGKYHANYPEKDDVIPGYQHIRRIEIIQIFRLLRPSKSGERPKSRGKPCIQRILILAQMGMSALGTDRRCFLRHYDLPAGITIVGRYSMSPPELSRNTPVTDIFQPVQINLVKPLRHKRQFSIFHCFNGRFCQLLHLHKPLLLYHRLHRCLTAVMSTYVMSMFFHFHQNSLLL